MSAVRLPRLRYCYTAFLAGVDVRFGQGTTIRNFPRQTHRLWGQIGAGCSIFMPSPWLVW